MSERNKAVKVFAGVFLAISMIGVSGCDFLDDFFHRKAEVDAVVRQPPQPEIIPQTPIVQEATPTKGDCATLRHYVMTRLKLLKGRQSETDKELTALKADRQKFSERVKALSETNLADKKGTLASGLELLLNDGIINELAYKYLGNDFAVIRHEFSEKVRNVIAFEQKNRGELERRRSKIEESVAKARRQTERVRKENDANIARLKKEIKAKEKTLNRLRGDLAQHSKRDSHWVETCKDEIRHVEGELSRLNSDLRQATQASCVRDADRKVEVIEKQACLDSRRLDDKAVRRGECDVTAELIAEKYEKMTIRRLDSALHERNQKAQKSQKLLSEQALFLESVSSGLETLDSAGLKRVRAEVEKELSRTIEGSDK